MTIAARAKMKMPSFGGGTTSSRQFNRGSNCCHVAFVEDQLAKLSVSHSVLFERIQAVTDLQVAWLLLVFCAASRANFYLRVVHPRLVHTFAERHDAAVWMEMSAGVARNCR